MSRGSCGNQRVISGLGDEVDGVCTIRLKQDTGTVQEKRQRKNEKGEK